MRCTICDKILDEGAEPCYDDLCLECDEAVAETAEEGLDKRASSRETK